MDRLDDGSKPAEELIALAAEDGKTALGMLGGWIVVEHLGGVDVDGQSVVGIAQRGFVVVTFAVKAIVDEVFQAKRWMLSFALAMSQGVM